MRVLVVTVLPVILLAGCTSTAATPTETVTVSAPAPEATAAARTDDAPIDGFDAYYFCLSQAFAFATGTSPGYADGELNFAPYSADIVTAQDEGFKVQLRGSGSDVDSVYCVVGGTLGSPTIDDYSYPR